MTRHEESTIQIACVKWFRLQYPDIADLMFAVPNGGKRNPREAKIMKAEGVTRGVSDLIILVPQKGYASLCIEMKTKKGTQSKEQKQWQAKVERWGSKYVVCRDIYSFMKTVKEYFE